MTVDRARYVSRLRRYPALGFLAAAALLASLLPSALRVPLSGPTASAELAPVPGKSNSAPGDLSALGQTSTGGLGGDESTGTLGPRGFDRPGGTDFGDEEASPSDGSGRNPSEKRCVGKPARQTEDPLSPPCVPFFKGDNGGVTAKGVTGDEIRIAYVRNCAGRGSQTQYNEQTAFDAPGADRRLMAYLKHFNDRFQTYGRRVRLWDVRWCGSAATPADRASRVAAVDEQLRPFAMLGDQGTSTWDETSVVEAATRGTFAVIDEPLREVTRRHAPFVMSFPPDLEGLANQVVGFVCARLAGRPARFAPDPVLQSTRRKFAVVWATPGDPTRLGARLIREGLAAECGASAGEVEVYDTEDPATNPSTVAAMRTRGVTTVIFNSRSVLPTTADSAKWYPEWLFPSDSSFWPNNNWPRTLLSPVAARGALALGITRRVDDVGQQPHTVAAREGCSCDDSGDLDIYESLLLLFTGIQAAGPRLTPANVDKGLHAIPPHPSPDPRTPAAYFEPGEYSFVKDSMAMRWDGSGTRRGNLAPGCYRLAEGGKRYRAGDWRTSPGDEALATAVDHPCQAD